MKEDKEREPFYFGGQRPEVKETTTAAASTVASIFGAKKDSKFGGFKKKSAVVALTAFQLSSGD